MHLRMDLRAFRREFWIKSDQGSAAGILLGPARVRRSNKIDSGDKN